jgi:acyl-CoA synthetase (AMP-forming)/AMP-acid ligase II/acetyltransferase-like isoleucine patch superfamily enzyme/acyl carrier protein
MTVAARILTNAESDEGREFLRLVRVGQPDEIVSYRELVDEALRWTRFYDSRGLAKGDRIIVVQQHSLGLYASYAGALLGGYVPAMFAFPSAKFSEEEYFRTIGTLLAGARARLLVTYDDLAGKLHERERAALGETQVVTAADLGDRADRHVPDVDPDDPAFLQYSSGTTGIKKGVAVSHRALLWQVDTYADAIGATPSDRIVSWLPLYHDMGLIACFFLPLIRNVPLVAMSPFDWVKRPGMWTEAVAEHRATLSWLPNFAYNFLAANVRAEEAGDLSSLRGVVNCSEPILAASHDAFLERFEPHGFSSDALAVSYALAENTFAATSGGFGRPPATDWIDRAALEREGRAVATAAGAEGARHLVSSGPPLRETDVAVVDEQGRPVPERTIGEIQLRSPALMTSYDGNEEATRDAFRDGWYRTRDAGYLADGQLYVTGRRQDIVIVGGRNIYPQDVEAVANEVEGVLPGRVVAFGIPQEDRGTESLVVLAETEAENTTQIREAVREAIVAHADLVPGDIRLLPPRMLVKSTAGKISRTENRRRYLEEWSLPDERTSPEPNDADGVRRAVLRFVGADVADDAPLLSSGLIDSFATVELLGAVEQAAGMAIPAHELADSNFDSIADILALVSRLRAGSQAAPAATETDVPMTFDGPRPAAPAGHRVRSLLTRLRLQARGVRIGRRFRVAGPVLVELLGAGRNLEIGNDVVLMPGVHLKLRENGCIVLHDGVKLDTGVRLVAANDARLEIGQSAALGRGTLVNAGADVLVGRGSMTAAYCVVNASDHGLAAGTPMREQRYEHAPITVGEDVWVGAHAFIAKGARIGDGAIVSAGAIVSGPMPPGAIVQGRPARVVGFRR